MRSRASRPLLMHSRRPACPERQSRGHAFQTPSLGVAPPGHASALVSGIPKKRSVQPLWRRRSHGSRPDAPPAQVWRLHSTAVTAPSAAGSMGEASAAGAGSAAAIGSIRTRCTRFRCASVALLIGSNAHQLSQEAWRAGMYESLAAALTRTARRLPEGQVDMWASLQGVRALP